MAGNERNEMRIHHCRKGSLELQVIFVLLNFIGVLVVVVVVVVVVDIESPSNHQEMCQNHQFLTLFT